MVALAPDRYRAVCTPLALPILRRLGLEDRATAVRPVPNAVWEQVVLPRTAARLGAAAIYSHRECGALWGPPQLLHVPEDPENPLATEPTTEVREQLRRRYSRLLMDRSLARAEVVVSTSATRDDLARHHHVDPTRMTVVPLGVDLDLFRPDVGGDGPPFFFTLASADDRDRTDLIVRAFAHYRTRLGGRSRLVIGGSLGERSDTLQRLAAQLQVGDDVELTGRLTDAELVRRNTRAVATVHASPDEGFGLQPLEAMAGGSLLVATPSAALEEVAADAVVVWVDPEVAAMADGLRGPTTTRPWSSGPGRGTVRWPRASPGTGRRPRCTGCWSGWPTGRHGPLRHPSSGPSPCLRPVGTRHAADRSSTAGRETPPVPPALGQHQGGAADPTRRADR